MTLIPEQDARRMIVDDYRRETGGDVSQIADVLYDRAMAAHYAYIEAVGYCPGGYCCDGTGQPEPPDTPEPEPTWPCPWCGVECGNPEGHYQCQCEAHALGAFDMDRA